MKYDLDIFIERLEEDLLERYNASPGHDPASLVLLAVLNAVAEAKFDARKIALAKEIFDGQTG